MKHLLFLFLSVGLSVSAASITDPYQGNPYQIANGAGELLSWDNGTLRALPEGDCEAQTIYFTPVDGQDGLYNITFDGVEGYLAAKSANGWTAELNSDPANTLAQFSFPVSAYDSEYVNLKIKGMNRGSGMLGQDAGDTTVYTDKSDGALSIWEIIPLTNEDPNILSLSVDPAEATIGIYETVQLYAVVETDDEQFRLRWTSSNPSVASVSSKGLVRGLLKGEVDITVECGDKTAACHVTVAAEDKYAEYDLPESDVRKYAYDGYKLVFAEEFSVDGDPDYTVWNLEDGYSKRNNEDQYYVNPNSKNGQYWGVKNAWVEDGCLVIQARNDNLPNPDYFPHSGKPENYPYSSASLQTIGSWDGGYSWLFGIYEVRAKIKHETGLWPAIWSTGEQYEWPYGGEIDIMEYYGNKLHANVCWGDGNRWSGHWKSATVSMSSLPADWDQDYHIWRMIWDYDTMQLWVDDILVNEIDLNTTVNDNPGTDWYNIDGLNPFRDVRQMGWVNLALGGNNGGSLANTVFPSYYLIDYFRVYQKIGTDGAATYHVDDVVSEPTFDPASVKSIAVDEIAEGPIEVFDLWGRKLDSSSNLKGIYIVRQGSRVRKVAF